jgi:DeoR/GlpR family transcriptional regulator of sugar metabolism
MKLLMLRQHVKTEELVEEFNVSVETIRRDINELVRQGMVVKMYGGIKVVQSDNRITVQESWNKRLQACHDEKIAIVSRALEFVPDGATIALDTGTTIYEFSRMLGTKKNLTVLTNSLNVASELSQNTQHTIYSVGGVLNRGEIVTVGTFACGFLDNFTSIDLFICSADGLTLENGITEFNENMVDIKKRMSVISDRIIALVDHSKIGRKSLFKSIAAEEIDVLVTDAKAAREEIEMFHGLGMDVIVTKE